MRRHRLFERVMIDHEWAASHDRPIWISGLYKMEHFWAYFLVERKNEKFEFFIILFSCFDFWLGSALIN